MALDMVMTLSHFTVAGRGYLIAASTESNGSPIFTVGDDGGLTFVQNLSTGGTGNRGMVAEVSGEAFFIVTYSGKNQARVYDLHSQNPDGTSIGTRTDIIAEGNGTHNMLSTPLWGDVWQANGKTFVAIPACPMWRDKALKNWKGGTAQGRLSQISIGYQS